LCFNNQIDRNRISNVLTNILEDDNNNIYDDETITGNRVNCVLDRITENCLNDDDDDDNNNNNSGNSNRP
jgi:hypothetical protein